MEHTDRWEIIKEIGQGGQGKVYRVIDKDKFHTVTNLKGLIKASITGFAGTQTEEMKQEAFEKFKVAVLDLINREDADYHGALKVLHEPEMARDAERAKERIKLEIEVMAKNLHPNLINILDSDPEKNGSYLNTTQEGLSINAKLLSVTSQGL